MDLFFENDTVLSKQLVYEAAKSQPSIRRGRVKLILTALVFGCIIPLLYHFVSVKYSWKAPAIAISGIISIKYMFGFLGYYADYYKLFRLGWQQANNIIHFEFYDEQVETEIVSFKYTQLTNWKETENTFSFFIDTTYFIVSKSGFIDFYGFKEFMEQKQNSAKMGGSC